MSTSGESLIHEVSDAGIAAEHPLLTSLPMFLAPGTSDAFNTLRPSLRPIACWSIGDARFKFSCSFVWPEIAEDTMSLAALVGGLEARHGKRPLASVFGHADPVGNESFNKQLSGRRAAAIYALLTRRTDIWEDIFAQKGGFTSPLSADDWGGEAIGTMLTDLGYTAPESDNAEGAGDQQDPVTAFQRDHGLVEDGQAGPATRDRLFGAYMDKHCRTRERESFKLESTDFVGRGEDPAGKADYQGCSEFNPLLILSKQEQGELPTDERDRLNAANRRVLVYLFDPRTVVAAPWPCPRAREGLSACRQRLWSDAQQRRAPDGERRCFEDSRDTFACRFYGRLATASPCERVIRVMTLRVRLFDQRNNPMPDAPYRLTLGESERLGRADSEAFLVESVSRDRKHCQIEWRAASDAGGETDDESASFEFSQDLRLDFAEQEDEEEQAKRRLANLGYPIDLSASLEEQQASVRRFQRDSAPRFALVQNGLLDEPTRKALIEVHDQCVPVPLSESQLQD